MTTNGNGISQTPITPATHDAGGVKVQPAYWIGAGGVLHARDLDGIERSQPVAVQPGSLVVVIPPPDAEQLARALGILGPQGTLLGPDGRPRV